MQFLTGTKYSRQRGYNRGANAEAGIINICRRNDDVPQFLDAQVCCLLHEKPSAAKSRFHMPELPEVHNVAESLKPMLIGNRITRVIIRRADVIRGSKTKAALLEGQCVRKILRHGKQLALVGDSGRCLCVHLGMSGALLMLNDVHRQMNHVHVEWQTESSSRLIHHDPRRFGGIWTFDSVNDVHKKRWSKLGPDALTIQNEQLSRILKSSSRMIKAALLDQSLIAGLGNIYVDELLFRARVHPEAAANRLSSKRVNHLAELIPELLQQAISSGGSTLRDYRDSNGREGSFQTLHQVYGRAGQPCLACSKELSTATVAGRTTVWCSACQRRQSSRRVSKRRIIN